MVPSGPEWFIVLAVVLVIFGGSQLPKLARNIGKAQREFKDGARRGGAPTRTLRPSDPGHQGAASPPTTGWVTAQ